MPHANRKASCQCCICGGKQRDKQTVAAHAQRPRIWDVFIEQQASIDSTRVFPIEFAAARDEDVKRQPRLRNITPETRDLLRAYDLYFAQQDTLNEQLWPDDELAPSLGLLITMHLDWISTFRVSDVSAAHVWATMRSLLSSTAEGATGPLATTTYDRILAFVEKHKLETVEKIPVCPCGLVIYHDFCNEELRKVYKFCSKSDRTGCAICGLSKFIPNTTKPRKVIYYISPEIWMRDLYQRADIVPALRNDTDRAKFATGSLRRSAGWASKVMNNPHISSDPRHAPIVGHADGGPYFKGGDGGGWFFILRHACLPESLLLDQSLAHMTILISSEHWEDTKDPVTGLGDGIFKKVWR